MFRRTLLAAVLSCSMLLPAVADAEVLAENDFFDTPYDSFIQPFYPDYQVMQTFVPAFTGTSTSVEVTVHQAEKTTAAAVTIRIFELTEVFPNGLQPTGAPLATGSLGPDDPQWDTFFITWKTIPLSPAELQAGTTYGLVLDAEGTNRHYDWYSRYDSEDDTDIYPAGNLAIENGSGTFAQQPQSDVTFRLNAVPEPTSIALLGLGGLALLRRRRH